MATPPHPSDVINETYTSSTIQSLRKRMKRRNESSHIFYIDHGNENYTPIRVFSDNDTIEEVNQNSENYAIESDEVSGHQEQTEASQINDHRNVEEVTEQLEQAALQSGSGEDDGDSTDSETAPYIANYKSIPKNPPSGDNLDGKVLWSNKRIKFVSEVRKLKLSLKIHVLIFIMFKTSRYFL